MPVPIVARTTTGPIVFGMMCVVTRRQYGIPCVNAISTQPLYCRARTCTRTTRANRGTAATPIARMMFVGPGPTIVMTTRASRISGTALTTSRSRTMTSSTARGASPASVPMTVPTIAASRVAPTPIDSEYRAPWMMRDSTSRPMGSVPSGCAALGAWRAAAASAASGGYGASSPGTATARPRSRRSAPRTTPVAMRRIRRGDGRVVPGPAGAGVADAIGGRASPATSSAGACCRVVTGASGTAPIVFALMPGAPSPRGPCADRAAPGGGR